ncbi:hypothetical protein, partial [Cryobacterium sp. N19]|uniref:hypothetical protein n=1 Tax=Cryobacterium sp. N19 TaxID=2048288 RepID=UPI001E3A6D14
VTTSMLNPLRRTNHDPEANSPLTVTSLRGCARSTWIGAARETRNGNGEFNRSSQRLVFLVLTVVVASLGRC